MSLLIFGALLRACHAASPICTKGQKRRLGAFTFRDSDVLALMIRSRAIIV